MKKCLVFPAFLFFFVGSVARTQDKPGKTPEPAAHEDAEHVVVQPSAIQWRLAPLSLPRGAQATLLIGNPYKAGAAFVLRVKLPDGYKLPAHWHPTDENLTVLQGTLLIGTGDKLDTSKMEELPTGAFMHMPKTMRHFTMAKGETIIQLHGVGPFDIHYVNPADDPRKREEKK